MNLQFQYVDIHTSKFTSNIISEVGDKLRRMYVNIFLKGSVGLFQKHFASFSETSSRKNLVLQSEFSKKQVRIKELENRDEANRKARSYFNFIRRTF